MLQFLLDLINCAAEIKKEQMTENKIKLHVALAFGHLPGGDNLPFSPGSSTQLSVTKPALSGSSTHQPSEHPPPLSTLHFHES